MTVKDVVLDDIQSSLIATVNWEPPEERGVARYATYRRGDVFLVKHHDSGQVFAVRVSESTPESWAARREGESRG
jgi:hypothetical protein